jgi:hypothetical protein
LVRDWDAPFTCAFLRTWPIELDSAAGDAAESPQAANQTAPPGEVDASPAASPGGKGLILP